MLVKEELGAANLTGLGADEVNAVFDAAKKKAVEAVGGFVRPERGLPTGVYKAREKFKSMIWWGGKNRTIGTFANPEQASAACVLVKEELDAAKQSASGSDEVKNNAVFTAAMKKALLSVKAA